MVMRPVWRVHEVHSSIPCVCVVLREVVSQLADLFPYMSSLPASTQMHLDAYRPQLVDFKRCRSVRLVALSPLLRSSSSMF